MSIFTGKDKDGNRFIEVKMIDGLSSYMNGTHLRLTLLDEKLQITKSLGGNAAPIFLSYSQITDMGISYSKEVVGKIIRGGLSAFSSSKARNKNVRHYQYEIMYLSSKENAKKSIVFELNTDPRLDPYFSKFDSEIRAKTGTTADNSTEINL